MEKVQSNANSKKEGTKKEGRKVQTDADVKKKAVKLVISHLKKKIAKEFFRF